MKLSARLLSEGEVDRPSLIWLHGLLGSGEDWKGVLPYFADWSCFTIDLPGHGYAVDLRVSDFAELDRALVAAIDEWGVEDYWLVGYSLGGRIAMYHACHGQSENLRGLIVEGGNLGLKTAKARQTRIKNDALWAERFRSGPIETVLHDWYRQPVFADLDEHQRAALIATRSNNQGEGIAAMLESTSLGVQPWLGDALKQRNIPFSYLCGERDAKFQALAQKESLPLLTIASAGHNAHIANPQVFAERLLSFLKSHI